MEIRKGSSSSYRSFISPGLMSNVPPSIVTQARTERLQFSSIGNRGDLTAGPCGSPAVVPSVDQSP